MDLVRCTVWRTRPRFRQLVHAPSATILFLYNQFSHMFRLDGSEIPWTDASTSSLHLQIRFLVQYLSTFSEMLRLPPTEGLRACRWIFHNLYTINFYTTPCVCGPRKDEGRADRFSHHILTHALRIFISDSASCTLSFNVFTSALAPAAYGRIKVVRMDFSDYVLTSHIPYSCVDSNVYYQLDRLLLTTMHAINHIYISTSSLCFASLRISLIFLASVTYRVIA